MIFNQLRNGSVLAVTLAAASILSACSSGTDTKSKDVASAEACAPADGVEFICGIHNVEKLTSIDGTDWAIAAPVAGGPVATPPLYFLNTKTGSYVSLDPASIKVDADAGSYPGCSAPDFSKFSAVGPDVRNIGGQDKLYVANHGGRMAVEVFDISTAGTSPALTWRGCIMSPSPTWFMDDVAIMSDGGFVVSSFFDSTDAKFAEKLQTKTPTGNLGLWRPGRGWKTLSIGNTSGANGIALTSDEKTVFFSDYGGNAIVKMDLASGAMNRVQLDFLVDNLMWDTSGNYLIAGGQNTPVTKAFECLGSKTAGQCDIPFTVVALQPETMKVTNIFGPGKIGEIGAGTGGLQVGDKLWLTTFRSDRIAKIPYPLAKQADNQQAVEQQ